MRISSKNRTLRLLGVFFSIVLVFSCGTNPTSQPGSGKGSVALFFTDNISMYQQVVSTITGVRLINSGTAEVCEVLKEPVTYNLASLKNLAQYADLAQCPQGRYNRIDVDIRKGTQVMDQLGTASDCSFTSFIDESGQAQPLACDQGTGICTLSVRGGARNGFFQVQEDQYNDLGIDFDLKKFTIANFGNSSSCSVTVAVSPLGVADMNKSGRAHGVTGSIANLDTASGMFTLLPGGVSLTVDYSRIRPSLQPNVDQLLLFAQTEGLLVDVLTGNINIATGSIAANRLSVKAAGTVSNVNGRPVGSFTLEYQPGKTMEGSYKPPADIQGVFTDGAWVNVKFDGYDVASNEYLAASIEVLPTGTVLDE